MSIAFHSDPVQNRVCELENKVNILLGEIPVHKLQCWVCLGRGVIDESFHGSSDFHLCSYCDGGKEVKKANNELKRKYQMLVSRVNS